MRGVLLTIAVCVALAGCKTTEESLKEAGKKPMSSAQINALLGGKTSTGTNSNGRTFAVKYNTDGEAMLNSGNFSDKGKWWVEGNDLYCSQWAKLRDGAKSCRRIYDVGGQYQSVNLDGTESSTFTIK